MHQVNRKSLTRFAGVALSVLCLAFFFFKAQASWSQVGSHIELGHAWPGIVLGLVPYMLAYAIFASNWHLLMRTLGDRGSLMTSWGIFLTAQFGKYLPGNVGHHAGRVAIGMKHGQLASQIVVTMLIETVMALVVAGLLSLSMTGLVSNNMYRLWGGGTALKLILVITVIILIATLTLLLVRQHHWLARLRVWITRHVSTLRSKRAIRCIALCTVMTFVALSLSSTPLLLLSADAPALAISGALYAAGLFCAAWIAGMFTPGAPAGLGVREVILVQGLTPLTGAAGAVTTTILFRVLTVTADLLAFVTGIALLRLFPGTQVSAAPDP